MSPWVYAIGSTLLVSLVSLVGIVFVSLGASRLRSVVTVLVSLAAGALFGDAFVHLLPESYARLPNDLTTSMLALGGIITFYCLESILGGKHSSAHAVAPVGILNLAADGVHNFIDGLLIGASYLVDVHTGIATTVAVLLHEIPQEIGDFGVLVHAGFGKAKALALNLATALIAIAGAAAAVFAGEHAARASISLVPFAAGSFIYIAGSDLVPILQKEPRPARRLISLVVMALGVGLIVLPELGA